MKSTLLAGTLMAGVILKCASGHPIYAERALVTEVVYVTETVTDVVVFVNENGVPCSTTTMQKASSIAAPVVIAAKTSEIVQTSQKPLVVPQVLVPSGTSTTASGTSTAASEQPSSAIVTAMALTTPVDFKDAPTQESSDQISPPPPASTTPNEAPTPQPSSPATDVHTEQSQHEDHFGTGITYDPFGGTQESPRCKTEQEITTEFDSMRQYNIVRIYGMGCNIIPIAMKNVLKNGQKLMAGAYLRGGDAGEDLSQVVQILKNAVDEYAGGSWDVVRLFSVENERVNDHDMTASATVDAIHRARAQLQDVGFYGSVGAVETVPAMIGNTMICDASDVVMVNCHAFFDTNTAAEKAGAFVQSEIERVKTACSSKRVVVTESGWPHQGDTNGQAVASPVNQRTAIDSLRRTFNTDVFIHNAFDSTWKSDSASTFNSERFWGVM